MNMLARQYCVVICTIVTASANADVVVMPTTSTTAVIDLTETNLEKRNDLLDCSLRLEGAPSSYELVYRSGRVPVPDSAITKIYGNSHRLIAVRGTTSGLPVEQLFVRYRAPNNEKYRLPISCPTGTDKCYGEVAYELHVAAPTQYALKRLRAAHIPNAVHDNSTDPNVNPRAIMLTDRPGLMSPAMDGLGGASNKRDTIVHYVCGTEN